jgi:hypothetical protein
MRENGRGRLKLLRGVRSVRSVRSVVSALAIAGVLLASSGCTAVKPWQRARLAKPMMQLDPEPESTLLEQHVYQYREGSAGGYGGLGGGCGCN